MNQATIDTLSQDIGTDNLPVLLGIFTSELEQYYATLTSASEPDRANHFQEICHALKSSAASFGAEDLCALSTVVDNEVKDAAYHHDMARVDEFLSLLQRTLTCYQSFLASLDCD